MKNLILYVSAEDDWHIAEQYRLSAEQLWKVTNDLTRPEEKEEQKALAELRGDLDQLKVGNVTIETPRNR